MDHFPTEGPSKLARAGRRCSKPFPPAPTDGCKSDGGNAAHNFLTIPMHIAFMSNYIRPQQRGATVFFTVTLAARGTDLLTCEIEALRQSVRVTRMERPFGIDAWVVLPDHMHCVWTLPAGDADFSTRWSVIKARFSRAMPHVMQRRSHEKRREHGIWQRRFWEHHIRNEEDYRAHIRYCWINPVKHGFVEHPRDWPFSSYHRDGGGALM